MLKIAPPRPAPPPPACDPADGVPSPAAEPGGVARAAASAATEAAVAAGAVAGAGPARPPPPPPPKPPPPAAAADSLRRRRRHRRRRRERAPADTALAEGATGATELPFRRRRRRRRLPPPPAGNPSEPPKPPSARQRAAAAPRRRGASGVAFSPVVRKPAPPPRTDPQRRRAARSAAREGAVTEAAAAHERCPSGVAADATAARGPRPQLTAEPPCAVVAAEGAALDHDGALVEDGAAHARRRPRRRWSRRPRPGRPSRVTSLQRQGARRRARRSPSCPRRRGSAPTKNRRNFGAERVASDGRAVALDRDRRWRSAAARWGRTSCCRPS